MGEFEQVLRSIKGWLSPAEGQRLRELAAGVTEGVIVEVGSYRGRSTYALSAGAYDGGQAPVYAIEPHEPFTGLRGGEFGPADRAAFFRNMLRTESWRNVRLVNLSSETVTAGWARPVGLLWIDGDHSYEAVRRDFDCWAPFLLPGAGVVFDDAVNAGLGPYRLIGELAGEAWAVTERVGKIAVLRRA